MGGFGFRFINTYRILGVPHCNDSTAAGEAASSELGIMSSGFVPSQTVASSVEPWLKE